MSSPGLDPRPQQPAAANKRPADELQPRAQAEGPVKRRAAVACSSCRNRKVRCDVTSRGTTCTNCRLDNIRCVLKHSNRGRRRASTEASEYAANIDDDDVDATENTPRGVENAVPGTAGHTPRRMDSAVAEDFPVSLTFEGSNPPTPALGAVRRTTI